MVSMFESRLFENLGRRSSTVCLVVILGALAVTTAGTQTEFDFGDAPDASVDPQ